MKARALDCGARSTTMDNQELRSLCMTNLECIRIDQYCRECRKPKEELSACWEINGFFEFEGEDLICGNCAIFLSRRAMDTACGI